MRREALLEGTDGRKVWGYLFGKGGPSACIIGAAGADEVQPLYIGSQLVRVLRELEERGAIASNHQILVIPDAADSGEDDRLAAVMEYGCSIGFSGCWDEGLYVPHIQISEYGCQNPSLANLFGMPYVMLKRSGMEERAGCGERRRWKESLFAVYARGTGQIDEPSARQAVSAVLRFLTRMGMLRYTSHSGYIASVVHESDLTGVQTDASGIFRPRVVPGQEVHRSDVLAEILHPQEGEVISQILSPTDGIVFFVSTEPLAEERSVIVTIIRRLHE